MKKERELVGEFPEKFSKLKDLEVECKKLGVEADILRLRRDVPELRRDGHMLLVFLTYTSLQAYCGLYKAAVTHSVPLIVCPRF